MKQNRAFIGNTLGTILNWLIVIVVALTPVLVLPILSEAIFLPKHFLLFILAGVGLLLWTARFVVLSKVKLTVSPLLFPMGLFVVAHTLATIFGSTAIPEAFIGRLGLSIALFFLFVIGTSLAGALSRWIATALVGSATVLSLLTILAFTGVLGTLGFPTWLADKNFTLAGSMSTLLIVLVASLPLTLRNILSEVKAQTAQGSSSNSQTTRQAFAKLSAIVASIIILSGSVIAGILTFPTAGNQQRLPLSIGWQIAIETLKERPFLGVGPSGFLSAYTRYRPISSNNSPVWNQRFQQAPNEFLHTFTETGLVGLVVLLFTIWNIVRIGNLGDLPNLGKGTGARAAMVLMLASLLLFPLNAVTMSVFVMLMVTLVLEKKAREDQDKTEAQSVWDATIGLVALREGLVQVDRMNSFESFTTPPAENREQYASSVQETPILSWIFLAVAVILTAPALYFTNKAWSAELSYKQALDAIIANDGTTAYNKLIETITRNPWFDNYHRQYADVNLRLANSLASQRNLGDDDRANVTRLIQQAIREGKIATQLDPDDVRNWETLASIYRALINVAQGAQDFTVLTYSEAIRRDPVNPLLRVDLGGVFYNTRDWESAIRSFQASVNLKPDYANGYYNLALAYEQDNKTREAIRAMQATLQSLDANSPDYPTAQAKLEELLKKSGSSSAPSGPPAGGESQLKGPEPLPTPAPGTNRVKLGEEEAPPVTPTPTGTPPAGGSTPTPKP